ncbi:hypothetical protein HU200_013636 [Digitaria exilis]|uniref:F-box domain-containing protein n=1 Tax=Digitaria exilis TaxID=1010633 RepID=A0A835KM73_9POAL|nr:hypothetical protein HU200_013636 [Digitaria exilis]
MDVLFEVLLRLPASLLCRLRLVCRSWRSLTADPVFATAHASRHRPLLAGYHIGSHGCEVRVVDLSGNVINRIPIKPDPIGYCNTQLNLVCVSEVATHRISRSSLVNVATGDVTTLIPDVVHDGDAANVVVSPLLLGHVPSTGERKVFYSCLCSATTHVDGRVVQTCGVATVGGGGISVGAWRATASPPAFVASGIQDRVVTGGLAFFLLNQWYNQRNNHGDLEPDAISVLDLATEEWRPAMLGGPLSSRLASDDEKLRYLKHRDDVRLASLNGCLVAVHHNYFGQDLWFLEDMNVDKGLWTKRYSIRCASSVSYPLLII